MPSEVRDYIPQITAWVPERVLKGNYGTSAWAGLENLLLDICSRFKLARGRALEFGVEHGYSTVALSGLFDFVIGVDPFGQMTATPPIERMQERAFRNCSPYDNIQLLLLPWQKFAAASGPNSRYDLIHVDAEHGYHDTYGPGEWACQHSNCVLFHDTLSFPQTVMPACKDLAHRFNMAFYNYAGELNPHGLGILVREGAGR